MAETKDMFDASAWKVMGKMCIPSVMTILVMMLYNLADTFFVGQLGDYPMVAGLTAAGPIMSILSALGTLLGHGACAALANDLGRNAQKQVKGLSSFGFWGAVIAGGAFCLVLQVGMEPILRFAGAKEEALPHAKTYLTILAWAAPIMVTSTASGGMIRAEGAARQSMYGNGLGTIINIILDPIFVLILGLGVAGAAVATVIANLVSLSYYAWYFLRRSPSLSIAPKDFTLCPEVSLRVLTLGFPSAVGTLMSSVAGLLGNNLLSTYSQQTLAAYGIAGKVIRIANMFQIGITSGMQPVFAYFYGGKDIGRLKEFLQKTAMVTAAIGTGLTALCFTLGPVLVPAFLNDSEVIPLGIFFVRLGLLAGPIAGIPQLCSNFFQSTERPGLSLLLAMARDGFVYLPLLYLLNSSFGLVGYICARPAATLSSTLIGIALLLYRWKALADNPKE